ncbi:MAG: permease-like cell division protein FtsX [Clostridia bacterium]|nr:permease-like cell division protein FtsX [Clostridia bacterium]
MKLHSLRYLIREGFRNIWQNRFMAIASIAVLVVCLLLTGFSYLILENVRNAFDWVYGQNVVVAFADTKLTDEQVTAIGTTLEGLNNVKEVTFLSKEDSLKKYGDSLPEATYESLQGENNPLSDAYIVTFHSLEQFEETVNAIKAVEGVEDTAYDGNIAKTLATVRKVALTVGIWVVVLLLAVSLFIIANTIKLTVYNRRLEIYIMRSVGATGAFIRIPFIVEGMVLGLISAILSYGIIWLLYDKLLAFFPTSASLFSLVPFARVWWVVLVGFVVIGMTTGMFGSAIATGKYLHKEGSEKV